MGIDAGAGKSGPIVVIGSVNMDLVCRTAHLPGKGETILGRDFLTIPGGKGANQAVAAARMGGRVHMIARVGDDDFGARLLAGLRGAGVNTRHVLTTRGAASGCALIVVDDAGENCIVVVPGANHRLMPRDIDGARRLIARASAVVLQLEIPLETAAHAVEMCRKLGVYTILDPAPVPMGGLPRALYGVDLLTPNETEAAALGAERSGEELLRRGAKLVVLKLGGRGAKIVGPGGVGRAVAGFKVKVVDTTAAGDAFTGALAVGLAEGMEASEAVRMARGRGPREQASRRAGEQAKEAKEGGREGVLYCAVRMANAAGALCCTRLGAQPAMASRAEVAALMRRRGG